MRTGRLLASLLAAASVAAACAGSAAPAGPAPLPPPTALPAGAAPAPAPPSTRAAPITTSTTITTTPAGAPGEASAWPPGRMGADEFYALVKACIERRGFAATVNAEERYVEFRYDDQAQLAKAQEAMHACFDEVDPTFNQPPPAFSDAQLGELYPYVVAQAGCLAEAGYPALDAPSFDFFAEELRGFWDPAGELAEAGVPLDYADVTACRAAGRPAWLG